MTLYFEWSDQGAGTGPAVERPDFGVSFEVPGSGPHYALERKVQVAEVDAETGELGWRTEYRIVCAACVEKYGTYRPWPWHRPDVEVNAAAAGPG